MKLIPGLKSGALVVYWYQTKESLVENLTLDQIKLLSQRTQSPSISIYLPTHRAGQDTQQDPIRFKNLVRDAERNLLDKGMGPREVSAILEPAQALLDDAFFWRHQREGLAVFIAPGDFHYYHLPFTVDELLIVAQTYYVKPILPLFTHNGHYFLLAFSQKDVRLFEGTRHTIGELELPEDAPESMAEALAADDPEKQLQFHSGTSQGGMRDSMFHGHGPGDEDKKERIERYLNLLDHGLRDILRDEQAPLVLAGVDYLLPIYRKVSEYPNIMETGVTGSPEQLHPEELHERAWPIVEPYFRQEAEALVEQYHNLASAEKATDDLETIIAAAYHGRIDKLMIRVGTQIWGVFDQDTGKVTHYQDEQGQEDDLPLIDFAAMQTVYNGGTVYALSKDEMPTESLIAAVLRY